LIKASHRRPWREGMKDKTKKVLKKLFTELKNQFIDFWGNVLIFFLFIPAFAIYAWFLGIIIRAIVIALVGYEPLGMNWLVYGLVMGIVVSMVVQGIQEGKKSLKELFKALTIYLTYFVFIPVALVIWLSIIVLLKITISFGK